MKASSTRFAMGTFLSVEAEGEDARRAVEDFCAEIHRLENLLSRFRAESELSRINAAAGEAPVRVGPETFSAVRIALSFARLSNGAFDPTLKGDHENVILAEQESSVFLDKPGMSLDLGGIGKGFALDRALERCRGLRVELLRADFGGQLLFWNAGGFEPEPVAIEDPRDRERTLSSFFVRVNGSVSTSSHAERPGHLRDPRTGEIARGTLSATVVAPTAAEAEAWSTALFIAGKAGLRWIEGRAGVEAFLYNGETTEGGLAAIR